MPESRRFSFRLALKLGAANPDAMLAAMPYRIWREWRVYDALDPFGETRADLRMGTLAATMANLWGRKQGRQAFTPQEFMPRFEMVPSAPRKGSAGKTPDQMFELIRAFNQAIGGEEQIAEGVELPDGRSDRT